MHATRAAQLGGILPGGGIALLHAANSLDEIFSKKDWCQCKDKKEGVLAVKKAILEPIKTILRNAGCSEDVVIEHIKESKKNSYGFDALNHKYGDMIEMGILDSYLVVKASLENAASASTILLTDSFIVNKPKDESHASHGGGHAGGGMGGMDY
jgi:chaperonin GroEL